MKLRVENIKLKSLISEATYQDAFSKIKNGDMLVIRTGGPTYKVKVLDKLPNRVIIKWDDQYYIITSNAYDGSNLDTLRLIIGKDGDGSKTVNGPTIKGVFNILVKRDGKSISSVTTEKGRNPATGKKQKKKQQQHSNRFDDIEKELSTLGVDDILSITTGKLITTGRDKGSLAKNTVTEFKFRVSKMLNKSFKLETVSIDGAEASDYDSLKSNPIVINSSSIKPSGEGYELTYAISGSGGGSRGTIKNVFGIENLGISEPDEEEEEGLSNTEILNLIKASPVLKNRYLGNPSLFNRLFNKNALTPKGDIVSLFNAVGSGLNDIKKGSKIKFKYLGKNIDLARDLKISTGQEYIGKYIGDNRIIIKSTNRRDAIEFKLLGSPDSEDVFVSNVKHKYIRRNTPGAVDLKRAKIKIIEKD